MKIPVEFQPCRYGDMFYLPKDTYIGAALSKYGEFCESEVRLFQAFVHPGSVVVEVGANIGAHTIPLAQLAKRVVAFEPQEFVCNLLRSNIAINTLNNVTIHNKAVGKASGTVMIPNIDYNGQANYGAMSIEDHATLPKQMTYPVELVTIDSYALPELDFLKIDCEGMEADVLKGATQAIKEHRPIIYVECDKEPKAVELLQTLESLDYRSHWLVTKAFNPDNWNNETEDILGDSVNVMLLCLHKDSTIRVDLFPTTSATVLDAFKGASDHKAIIDLSVTGLA